MTRLKQVASGDITNNRGVPIQRYTPPLKAALMNITMRPLLQLQSPFILPEQHNLIWHCIGMFSRLRPEQHNLICLVDYVQNNII